MQMFILISTYQRPLDEVDRARTAHLEWVAKHYESGRFLVSGRQQPPVGGVIVAQAVDRHEMAELLATDPFVQNGFSVYDIVEFTATAAAAASPGFGAFSANLATAGQPS